MIYINFKIFYTELIKEFLAFYYIHIYFSNLFPTEPVHSSLPTPISVIGKIYNSLVYLIYSTCKTEFSSGILVDDNKALVPYEAIEGKNYSSFMVRTRLGFHMKKERTLDFYVTHQIVSHELALIWVSSSTLKGIRHL